jgi:hypothetical protein
VVYGRGWICSGALLGGDVAFYLAVFLRDSADRWVGLLLRRLRAIDGKTPIMD